MVNILSSLEWIGCYLMVLGFICSNEAIVLLSAIVCGLIGQFLRKSTLLALSYLGMYYVYVLIIGHEI